MSDYQVVVDQAVQILKTAYSKVDSISDDALEPVCDYIEAIKDASELTSGGVEVVGQLYVLHALGLIEFKEIK